ncbi:MAG: methionine synthase [Bacteroidales bacterium]|nr:methionine synthase [Bacteroidales bacterium]
MDAGGRFLRLDGAMGTRIQAAGLTEDDFRRGLPGGIVVPLKGNNECLNLSRPDIIEAIHREYIAAGAQIIETNTFSANRISQKEYGLGEYAFRMAFEGAAIARRAASGKALVAGSMGPTSKSLTLASDLGRPQWRQYSFDEMAEAFGEQARALIEGGVDVLLLETAFDALNTKAALYAIDKVSPGFPVIVSVSVADRSARTITGQTIEAFYTAVKHYPIAAFGINCSLGASDMVPMLKDIDSWCEVPVICYPNAGLPDEMGRYTQGPADMAAQMKAMDGLVNIAGGCCGTTPEHIKALPQLRPRPSRKRGNRLSISGLEAYTIDTASSNFTVIGERTNVAGSRRFAKLIAAGDYDTALEVAARQIEGGAHIIDINMDDAMLDGPAAMETFVRCTQNDPAVAKAALMIDSSNWETLLKGLKNAQGRCIVNSISLKDGEQVFLEKARQIHRLGAAMVVMAFDEKGQATSFERKVQICQRAYKLLTGSGIPPEDIIFDVNVLSVATGMREHDRYALDFIEAVRWIKANLPGAYTSGGISNLSFAFRGNNPVRSAMHAVFLYHAIKAGLDMAIANPEMLQQYDDIEPSLRKAVEDVILCTDEGATERLIALAGSITAAEGPVTEEVRRAASTPSERLREAILGGRSASLEEDLLAVLEECGSPVTVIEGPLMAAMEEVGRRFGEGRMFLPQVVKSAKVMKDAVAVLEPFMNEEEGGSDRPLVIYATVKGDVHDIGKNIAAIVLRCNGFDVLDLGVMVPPEKIIDEAVSRGAAMIGVSGLITPSLFQMEELCRELSARGLGIPLFVGGATTSDLHTAVKLAPLYGHVFHAPDASAGAVMAKRCQMDREAFEKAQHEKQLSLRNLHEAKEPVVSAGEHDNYLDMIPDDIPLMEVPLDELVPLFDWKMFCATWGMKQNAALINEGMDILERFVREGSVSVRVAARFFPSHREGEGIRAGENYFPMLREKGSLADYVPSEGDGPFGIFAISVHPKAHPKGCNCETCSGEYASMMERAVRVTLAEAASTWLDGRIEKAARCKPLKPAAGYAACPDHSVKRDILALLPSGLDITLTSTCAMIPDASICGFIVLHPDAEYPSIRHISRSQYDSYAAARGFSPQEAKTYLSHLL